ncbi:S41 family peptidase [Candidatus Gottesmanbacteria bacterium]|nr:S41 family peptidase [Candidatus Gottesmanbacteria bacterium]
MKLNVLRNIILGISILVITFGIGYRVGQKSTSVSSSLSAVEIVGQTKGKNPTVDFSLFWDVWDRVGKYYIDKEKIDPQKMVYGAISGMVSSLGDPYTVFLPPTQNKEAKDDLGGKFEGIGAQLGVKEKKIVVIAPLKGTPAETAGIKSGDWIVKVDGKETLNWTVFEAVSKIRGPKGSSVELTIVHKDASSSSDIKVTRDTINVASVEWELKNLSCSSENNCKKVVYLKLSRFGDQTSEEWNKGISEILQALPGTASQTNDEIKGLVFDLRNNPGGYLAGSVFIASEFLKDGIVVKQESIRSGNQQYSVDRKGRLTSIPMVVLINKGTASAGEIVAGSLQERARAKLFGETTFGKGSVQEAQELEGGAGIHITTAKWLLPSGKWINGTGIEPDIAVTNDESKPEEDTQLLKALEYLIK